jgi:hypothetical protein
MIFERIGRIFAPAAFSEEKQEVKGRSMVGFRRSPDQVEFSRRGFLGMIGAAAIATAIPPKEVWIFVGGGELFVNPNAGAALLHTGESILPRCR